MIVSPKEGEMGVGTIEVPGGVERFEVVVAVEAEEALEGNEALRLSIGDEASEAEGKASLKSEECTPEDDPGPGPGPGPEPDPVVIGEVESVEGTAACELETPSEKDATLVLRWSLIRLVVKARGMTMRLGVIRRWVDMN